MLRHLQRVFVQFAPGDTAAREFLQRVSANTARKSNPACSVEFNIDDGAPPGSAFVELTFADNENRKLKTADYGVVELAKIIELKGGEMELRGVMKEVGYDPWRPDTRVAGGSIFDSQETTERNK